MPLNLPPRLSPNSRHSAKSFRQALLLSTILGAGFAVAGAGTALAADYMYAGSTASGAISATTTGTD